MTMSEHSPSPLKFELLIKRRESATRGTPPGKDDLKWVSNAVTLIYGDSDAVLVDTFLSESQTLELVDWIKSFGRNLKTIYVTHGHPDHFFGLKVLLDQFPGARAIAAPNVVAAMRAATDAERTDGSWSKRFPGQVPDQIVLAETLEGGSFYLEGYELRVVDIGHTDTDDTTALHVPSIGLLISGDSIYNETHPYLAESDATGRRAWLAAIDKIEELRPKSVVVGHGPLNPDCAPRHIQATRIYLQDFERLHGETATPRELYDRMLELYPDRINPGSLWAAAHKAKGLSW